MMGRQRRDQGRLFYEFRLEDRIPENHLLRRMNVFVTVALADLHKELEAPLQRHRPSFGRSRVDDPDAHRRLLLRHPLGTQAVPGSRAASWRTGGSASSTSTTRFRTTRRSRRTGWAASARAICCATSSSAWCGRRWRWGWSRAKASPSTPACWRPMPAAITARRPMSSTGPTSSARRARSPSILPRSTRRASPIPIASRRR